MSEKQVISTPEYEKKERGPVLIVGSAPCLFADYEQALDMRPGAHVIALNEAGGAIKHIDHLVAGHYYKAPQFIEYRQKKYPGLEKDYLVHACIEEGRVMIPAVDHWWLNAKTGATSAWTAARIAKAMGYEEIILCGCPLDVSGYFNESDTHKDDEGTPRVGHNNSHPINMLYRQNFVKMAYTEGEHVYSMSGWTSDILGRPV